MSEDFAQLIGAVQPIKRFEGVEDFGKPQKVLNRRHIEAQHAREDTPEDFALNLDNIPEERFKALCEGKIRISRCIDLHGFYVDEGVRVLQDALHQRENYRRQCWLIVHGKGRRSARFEVKAPLRTAVLALLKRHPAIAAFAVKQDFDNDSGSVLVEVHAKY